MSDQIMTAATETAAIVPEVWSAKFYSTLRDRLPFIDCVSNDWEGAIANIGDTVNISQVPDFDQASLLSEGAKGDSEAVTVTSQALVINKRAYKDVIVTKKSQLQSLPFMDKLRDGMIYSIMKKMQADIISAISPSSSSPDHVISYATGTTLAQWAA